MKLKKIALMATSMALVAALAVGGTLAYLTSTDTVTNTFTVGNVSIKLDEAKVGTDGKALTGDSAERVQTNSYKLMPGHEYDKDPTVTVKAGSEESYVKMTVTVNFAKELDAIFAPTGADLKSIFGDYNNTKWTGGTHVDDATNNTRTYTFYYDTTVAGTKDGKDVDVALEPLFKKIVVPTNITTEQLATLVTRDGDGSITDQFKITVNAYAIQKDGFDNATAAWTAFEGTTTTD